MANAIDPPVERKRCHVCAGPIWPTHYWIDGLDADLICSLACAGALLQRAGSARVRVVLGTSVSTALEVLRKEVAASKAAADAPRALRAAP